MCDLSPGAAKIRFKYMCTYDALQVQQVLMVETLPIRAQQMKVFHFEVFLVEQELDLEDLLGSLQQQVLDSQEPDKD
jgi:hypothetical protein